VGQGGFAGGNDLGSDGGGGGGGGGGTAGSATGTITGNATGGNGGSGGSGGPSTGNGGGGGGAAGYGAIVNTNVTNTFTVTGGAGGNGGDAQPGSFGGGSGGNGGAGGVGVQLVSPATTFTNSGSITGGNGGAAGAGGASGSDPGLPGAGGSGGAGIVGSGVAIINSGTISGGIGNAGTGAQANAITFTGGVNSLTLLNGSTITGNAVAFSTADTFALGGSTNSSFNTSLIGPAAQYQGFGVFNKTGTSTWTLTGTPGTATPWVISGGTLAAGASTNVFGSTSAITVTSPGILDLAGFSQTIGSLTGTGTVTNSGPASALTTGDATNTNFSGTIQGANTALIKQGTGTFTLSGTNTYSGATTVNAGTLAAGSSTAFSSNSAFTVNATLDLNGFNASIGSLAGSGSVTNNGGAAVRLTAGGDNTSTTFSGNIVDGTNATALTKTGTGTLTLTGTNTYTGNTNITLGTLAITGTGSIASPNALNVGAGAGTATFDISGTTSGASIAALVGATDGIVNLGSKTLTITNGATGVPFLGVINGSGGLTITGGTQALQGINGYNGATIINGGRLALSGTGSIAQSSLVTVGAGTAGTFDVSGTASGASIIGLAGDSNGIVTLGSKTLTITNASSVNVFFGVIADGGGAGGSGGGLTVTGGFQELGGANTYTGATTINGGTLNVTGSIAPSVLTTVNSTGTLTGTGTVGATTVASGGTFTPGSGTPGSSMTVNGSLALQSGAFYMVQINPTTSSFANVNGAVTLNSGARVDATFASGSYVSKKYTIIQATGTVSGTFNPTTVNTSLPSNFHTTLSYDTHDAYLNLILNFAIPGGLNVNQQNVGNALTNFFNSTGSIPLVFGALTPAQLSQASGETATGSQQTTFDAMNLFMGLMTDPFIAGRGDGATSGAGAPTGYASTQTNGTTRDDYAMFTKAPPAAFEQRWSVWAAGYGGSQTTDGNTSLGSNSTTSSIAGTAVGADYRISPNTLAGFALAGGGTSFSVTGSGSGHSDLFQAGAFVRHTVGPAYISAALAYGWQDITTNRTVTAAGIDQLRAEFNANAFSGRLEGGYRFVSPWAGGIGLTPYAAAQFTTFDLPAYAEQATVGSNAFALAYNAKDVTDARSEIGIRTDKSWVMQGAILTLRSRFAWAHDFDPDRSIAATFQTLPGASFTVNGAGQAHDSALTTASVEMKWINGWSAAATFEGEFSNVTSSYAGKGVVRYQW
jgi:autotransporter-associated beta strand protein